MTPSKFTPEVIIQITSFQANSNFMIFENKDFREEGNDSFNYTTNGITKLLKSLNNNKTKNNSKNS